MPSVGDVHWCRMPWKPGDDRDLLALSVSKAFRRRGCGCGRWRKRRVVRMRTCWPRSCAPAFHLLDGQRGSPTRDLLAGGDHHVLLALAGPLRICRHLSRRFRLARHALHHHHTSFQALRDDHAARGAPRCGSVDVADDVPPYFWTMSAISEPARAPPRLHGHRGDSDRDGGGRGPAPAGPSRLRRLDEDRAHPPAMR